MGVRTRADFPVEWAMTQNNLGAAYIDRIRGDQAKTDLRVSISPSLKFAEVELALGEVVTTIELRKLEPVIIGYGALEPAPNWDFEQHKDYPLRGSKFSYLIVKKPHGAEAVRLTLDLTVDVVTRHGLLSARVAEKDRAHLSQVVCTD